MLSVKELNEVLQKLQKELKNKGSSKEKISIDGTFAEVDIVFIAGLFLWYMQHKDSWEKISCSFNISDRPWTHQHYFLQIYELYNVRHDDIFENFSNADSKDANPFSRYYAPPIYITKKSIDYFFGKKHI